MYSEEPEGTMPPRPGSALRSTEAVKVGVIQDEAWADWISTDHVAAEFIGDSCDWPVPGCPAWIIIEAIDMPLLLIRAAHGGELMWVNAAIIKRVWK